MDAREFHIVDVFAEQKYAGNQLAVFRNAGELSGGTMQKLAKEMGFSETTFILSDAEREGGYDVRIFTPIAEVPFAGHPTLGTAYVIRHEILRRPVPRVNLNLQIGQIPVTFEPQADGGDIVWMTPKEAVFAEIFQPHDLSKLLTVDAGDIDSDFPIQSVSTGLPFVLLPLRSLEAVRRAGVVKDRWLDWVKDRPAKMVFVFCRETIDPAHHIHARMFADYYGVAEDPATGSANSCFAAYLVQHRYFGTDKIDIRVEQGYEIGRPSLIYLRAKEHDGRIDVQVGGKVIMVARAELV
ncbi:MAG: PhzF family phenazine biosynthesis protein [Planctomycetes bacterium]|nr:PhzF family phenazine biosynthesis protein [Planctomycetota bacterium]